MRNKAAKLYRPVCAWIFFLFFVVVAELEPPVTVRQNLRKPRHSTGTDTVANATTKKNETITLQRVTRNCDSQNEETHSGEASQSRRDSETTYQGPWVSQETCGTGHFDNFALSPCPNNWPMTGIRYRHNSGQNLVQDEDFSISCGTADVIGETTPVQGWGGASTAKRKASCGLTVPYNRYTCPWTDQFVTAYGSSHPCDKTGLNHESIKIECGKLRDYTLLTASCAWLPLQSNGAAWPLTNEWACPTGQVMNGIDFRYECGDSENTSQQVRALSCCSLLANPTLPPTVNPTLQPSVSPTPQPTNSPTITKSPTINLSSSGCFGEPGFASLFGKVGATALNLADDDMKLVALPFAFNWLGLQWLPKGFEIGVASNGHIIMNGVRDTRYSRFPIIGSHGKPRIALAQEDLDPGNGVGRILIQSSSRSLVVSFEEIPWYPNNPGVNVQAKLYPDGGVSICFGHGNTSGNRFATGLEDPDLNQYIPASDSQLFDGTGVSKGAAWPTGYCFCYDPFFSSIAGQAGVVALTLGNDDTVRVPLPFEFHWMGLAPLAQGFEIVISSNGQIIMDGSNDTMHLRYPINGSFGKPRIALVQEHLNPGNGIGLVLVKSSNSSLIVSFEGVHWFPDDPFVQAQATLFPDGRVMLCYGRGDTAGNHTFVAGLEDASYRFSFPADGEYFNSWGECDTWPTGYCYHFDPSIDIPSPTKNPSGKPSTAPSSAPTTSEPSVFPSNEPSSSPSENPSFDPSERPSKGPSSVPSAQPSPLPLSNPSDEPSRTLSSIPSTKPSMPSTSPSISEMPTEVPSHVASNFPFVELAVSPSELPSPIPINIPSSGPSQESSWSPSDEPSSIPSSSPSTSMLPSLSFAPFPMLLPPVDASDLPVSEPSTEPSTFPPSFSSYPSSWSDQPSVGTGSLSFSGIQRAISQDRGMLTLSWSPVVDLNTEEKYEPETLHYQLRWSTQHVGFGHNEAVSSSASVSRDETSYTIQALIPNEEYFFAIRACVQEEARLLCLEPDFNTISSARIAELDLVPKLNVTQHTIYEDDSVVTLELDLSNRTAIFAIQVTNGLNTTTASLFRSNALSAGDIITLIARSGLPVLFAAVVSVELQAVAGEVEEYVVIFETAQYEVAFEQIHRREKRVLDDVLSENLGSLSRETGRRRMSADKNCPKPLDFGSWLPSSESPSKTKKLNLNFPFKFSPPDTEFGNWPKPVVTGCLKNLIVYDVDEKVLEGNTVQRNLQISGDHALHGAIFITNTLGSQKFEKEFDLTPKLVKLTKVLSLVSVDLRAVISGNVEAENSVTLSFHASCGYEFHVETIADESDTGNVAVDIVKSPSCSFHTPDVDVVAAQLTAGLSLSFPLSVNIQVLGLVDLVGVELNPHITASLEMQETDPLLDLAQIVPPFHFTKTDYFVGIGAKIVSDLFKDIPVGDGDFASLQLLELPAVDVTRLTRDTTHEDERPCHTIVKSLAAASKLGKGWAIDISAFDWWYPETFAVRELERSSSDPEIWFQFRGSADSLDSKFEAFFFGLIKLGGFSVYVYDGSGTEVVGPIGGAPDNPLSLSDNGPIGSWQWSMTWTGDCSQSYYTSFYFLPRHVDTQECSTSVMPLPFPPVACSDLACRNMYLVGDEESRTGGGLFLLQESSFPGLYYQTRTSEFDITVKYSSPYDAQIQGSNTYTFYRIRYANPPSVPEEEVHFEVCTSDLSGIGSRTIPPEG